MAFYSIAIYIPLKNHSKNEYQQKQQSVYTNLEFGIGILVNIFCTIDFFGESMNRVCAFILQNFYKGYFLLSKENQVQL